jgi:hypothetical protein
MQLLHLLTQNKQTVQLDSRLRTKDSTPASALPSSPAACRPLERNPRARRRAADLRGYRARDIAGLHPGHKSAETPATSTTLPSCTVASTTTEDPSLALELIDRIAQRFGVGAVDLCSQNLNRRRHPLPEMTNRRPARSRAWT